MLQGLGRLLVAAIATLTWPIGFFAQEAKVLALDSQDAGEARRAWYELKAAEKYWQGVQDGIRVKYLRVPYGDKEAGSMVMEGITTNNATSGCFVLSNDRITSQTCEEEAERNRKEWDKVERAAKYTRKGWDNGFAFSEDFKFIVPKEVTTTPNRSIWNWDTPHAVTCDTSGTCW